MEWYKCNKFDEIKESSMINQTLWITNMITNIENNIANLLNDTRIDFNKKSIEYELDLLRTARKNMSELITLLEVRLRKLD